MTTQQTVIAKTSNHSLSANEVSGAYVFTNEGAGALVIFTLPSASASQKIKFIVQNANGIQVNAGVGDTINGSANISSLNIGDIIEVNCINTTQWIATIVNENSNINQINFLLPAGYTPNVFIGTAGTLSSASYTDNVNYVPRNFGSGMTIYGLAGEQPYISGNLQTIIYSAGLGSCVFVYQGYIYSFDAVSGTGGRIPVGTDISIIGNWTTGLTITGYAHAPNTAIIGVDASGYIYIGESSTDIVKYSFSGSNLIFNSTIPIASLAGGGSSLEYRVNSIGIAKTIGGSVGSLYDVNTYTLIARKSCTSLLGIFPNAYYYVENSGPLGGYWRIF